MRLNLLLAGFVSSKVMVCHIFVSLFRCVVMAKKKRLFLKMQLFAQSDDLFIGVKGIGSLTSTIEPVFYSFFLF